MKEFLLKKEIYFFAIVLLFLSSCRLMYPGVMFKTEKVKLITPENKLKANEYIVSYGDKIIVKVQSNSGYELVNVVQTEQRIQAREIEYEVNINGNVKLPLLDTVFVKGHTIRQIEKLLEEKYSLYFKEPFVKVELVNKKVMVFTGAGSGTVVPLDHENFTLIEVLAKSGGVAQNGKAYQIKLIRGEVKNPDVILIDLSTIEGMMQSELIVQPNDIIYVTPYLKFTTGVLNEITPIVGLLSSIVSILLIINLIK